MKKFVLILFLLVFAFFNTSFAEDNALRDYDAIEVPRGTFIPVISTQEISTLYFDENSKVEFIATTDLYLRNTNILPCNTRFYGYIEKINEPVIGTNASMKIKVTKFKLPDGFEIPVRAYIYTNNGNLIGGELTEPEKYDKKISCRQGYSIMTGYTPGATRKKGEHVTIASGADLLIVLVSPLSVTHTVTN